MIQTKKLRVKITRQWKVATKRIWKWQRREITGYRVTKKVTKW